MTDAVMPSIREKDEARQARLKRRNAAEKRFKYYGLGAIIVAGLVLASLIGSIVAKGLPAFFQNEIELTIFFDPSVIDPDGNRERRALSGADYQLLIKRALYEEFPDVTERRAKRALTGLVSRNAGLVLRNDVLADPSVIGQTKAIWLKASADVDSFLKDSSQREKAEDDRRLKDQEIAWIDTLAAKGAIDSKFNVTFFDSGDSREPEQAGILGAIIGSALTLIVTLAASFPIGVLAAVYLEEFAPKNKWIDLVEVNINNLAAVPSIVFGLLGLAVFLGVFNLPRSAPLVGGLVLALMTLPTIIIASRSALKAVPPSIREAAHGLGASPLQVVGHHTLPLAMPGILTGTIIGMAQALGESAPLLMIGMVAFIVDLPGGFTDPATVLPVQIYIWADSPERAFVEKTSAAIMVLLGFLVIMNALAIFLRKRFERKW